MSRTSDLSNDEGAPRFSPVQQARLQCARLGIPLGRYRQWRAERASAQRRGLAWDLGLPEWHAQAPEGVVVEVDPIDAAIRRAGVIRRSATLAVAGRGLGDHLRVKGAAHPRSRAVLTPEGRFASLTLAAEAFGVSRQAVCQWLREGRAGWRYDGASE